MILYPTETIYALGVNVLDEAAVRELRELKGRGADKKGESWLVRDITDIERFGILSPRARAIATRFLPGPLTLVLEAKDTVPEYRRHQDGEVSFRISPDLVAQEVINRFMETYDAPLSCTSANVSGLPTLPTPEEILIQFNEKAELIDEVVDDGPRQGVASTVVKVVGDDVQILREGAIPASVLLEARE